MNKYSKTNTHLRISYSKDINEYIIENYLSGTTYKTKSEEVIKLLQKLDGKTDPYQILQNRKKVDLILNKLNEVDLLETKKKSLTKLMTIYKPHIITSRWLVISKYIRFIMLVLFLPLLSVGIFINYKLDLFYEIEIGIINSSVTTIVCLLFHEIGHGVFALSYKKAWFYELGIGLFMFMIPFGYAVIDYSEESTLNRIAILGGGVITNAIMFGACSIIYCLTRINFVGVMSFNSVLMFVINCCLFSDSDGYKIVLELLSIDGYDNAKLSFSSIMLNFTRIVATVCFVLINILGVLHAFD